VIEDFEQEGRLWARVVSDKGDYKQEWRLRARMTSWGKITSGEVRLRVREERTHKSRPYRKQATKRWRGLLIEW
jgi:hypothetical protein